MIELTLCAAPRTTRCSYFPYNINGQPCDMVFTSVAGHLMELDFTDDMKKWRSCSPVDLYGAPVLKRIPQVDLQLMSLSTSCFIAFSCLGVTPSSTRHGALHPSQAMTGLCNHYDTKTGSTALSYWVLAPGQEAGREEPPGASQAVPVAGAVA